MIVTLTIVKYPKRFVPMAVLSMAIFRLPLWLNRRIGFYKLMGTGKNGTFDKHPEWQQWAMMATHSSGEQLVGQSGKVPECYGGFIKKWLAFFKCECYTIVMEPQEGHGEWDGKHPFGDIKKQPGLEGPVAILTRATIRFSKLSAFWDSVDGVAQQMATAPGLITSIGVGEVPLIKQATFSVWESREHMKAFAYQMHQHAEVIRKTRQEKWYSEEMFVRFKILHTHGTLLGSDPLKGIV